ncbi:ankyrin repeat domain-containing protein [Lewinella sp. 4G2]|uniref:ankyrin repeat domain-containing protein n=1 Tax=Lewinella sp. 4G2 TaxID=1803372 RepID=UPI0007B4C7D7|nr:ankyrin repeat domain-containing protein [Lewinella sp. 4G2]OAV43766.1 hypothetical protein A3850_004315 [Lewinella sp. 4G2]
MIEHALSPELVHAIGWSLVHSLWQAAVFALGLGGLLLALRKYSARARYYVSIAMLFGFFLTVGLTFAAQFQQTFAGSPFRQTGVSANAGPASAGATVSPFNPAPAAAPEMASSSAAATGLAARFTRYYNTHLPLIVTVWLLGVLVLQLRFVGQLAYLQRLKNYGTEKFPATFAPLLREVEDAISLTKAVRYLTSYRVNSPFTVGWLRPVVLFPATLLEQLNEPELRAIIAHELAHVKRHDFHVNLAQTLFCILFFYHPAVWWMSARIEEEREHCCDDLAIEVTGERVGYARTLVQLNEQARGPELAMALGGHGKGFKSRVTRLLSGYLGTGTYGEGFTSAVIIFGIMAVAVALSAEGTQMINEPAYRTDNVISNVTSDRRADEYEAEYAATQETALLMLTAASDGDFRLVQSLLDRGADVNATNAPNAATYTPLMAAVKEGEVEVARLLIERGADVNAIHEGGWTPLIYAASEDYPEVVQLLIESGAEVDYVNKNNWTALIEAADEDALECARILLKAGASVDLPGLPRSALTMAASEGHAEMIGLLIAAGASVNRSGQQNHPLHAAAEENNLDIVKLLIRKGADAGTVDGYGRNALHYAAEEGNTRIVSYLLAKGVQPDLVDTYGRTPLSYAAEEGETRIVNLLLDAGATVR